MNKRSRLQKLVNWLDVAMVGANQWLPAQKLVNWLDVAMVGAIRESPRQVKMDDRADRV
jgi:hypothetical protein